MPGASSRGVHPPRGGEPLFRFGLVSDVQHADIPDGQSFGGVPRYYRNALVLLRRAVEGFKASDVAFALHLGDIVDFHNSVTPPEPGKALGREEEALQSVLDIFDELECPVYHMIGNHCLYCHRRPVLNRRLGIDRLQDARPHSYYTVSPFPGWRLIVLDGYDVSALGWEPGHPLHEQAMALLESRNPNEARWCFGGDKNSPVGLEGLERRFVRFGGGVSDAQLAWLDGQLEAATAAGERVLVCCHLPLHPATVPGVCLLWNYDEVLRRLQAHPGTVLGTLCGHAHRDAYHRDEAGIHHRVCAAILETPPGSDCYGVVSVHEDAIEVAGHGAFESQVWDLTRAKRAP